MTERENDPAQGAPELPPPPRYGFSIIKAEHGMTWAVTPDPAGRLCLYSEVSAYLTAYRQARQAAPEAPRETVGASLTDERCATCGGRLIGLIGNACPHCRGAARLQQPKNCTSLFCPSGGDGPHTIIDALGAVASQATSLAASEAPREALTEEQQRDAFEARSRKSGYMLRRNGDEYAYTPTQHAWQGWMMATEASK